MGGRIASVRSGLFGDHLSTSMIGITKFTGRVMREDLDR
jgi:hypothetical protein